MEIHVEQMRIVDDLSQYADLFDGIFQCCYAIEKNDILARSLICNSDTKFAIDKRFREIDCRIAVNNSRNYEKSIKKTCTCLI